jgi:Ca2+-transporting ATPase
VVREYPLRHGALVYARAWSGPGTSVLIAAKGAPEAIAALCQLDARQLEEVQQQADGMARLGMRVLGVARRPALPGAPAELPVGGWEFLGLLGFADPLREGVPQAVSDCRAAGIRVVMITGDHPQTARAIARQAGIDAEQVLSGAELAALDATALATQVRTVSVYARIDPQQKLRIVQAFRANGEIVAMTGDGVNDAPSLKAAHIGIAMGRRGTDVAREAASLVLLDDDFGSIVQAVRLGRRIYDNLRKAMSWILAIHVPIAGLALLPLLFGLPLILTPMLIALLEMIIDPSCSIALEAEPEEAGLMRRPPRDPRAPLLSAPVIGWSLLQGLLGFLLTALLLLSCVRRGLPADETRALLFVATVGVLIVLILVNRSFTASPRAALAVRNPALWIGLAITTGLLAGLLLWPAARGFLGLGPLHADDLAIAGAAVVLLFLSLQLSKRLLPRSLRS